MAVDIGPRIGIDGEKEFRQQLGNINQQLRTLGSEMKAVTSAFDANDRSQEALAAQTDVLNRQIDAQEQKLQQLQRGLDAATKKFGDADTRTLRWQQAVNDAESELNRLRSQLSKTEREMDGTADATDDLADSMDEAEKSSSGFGSSLKSAFSVGAISGLVQEAVSGLKDLMDSTQEYRRIMASLEVSSSAAGYSAEETAQSYNTLYGVLGDEQTAATTVANLQAIGLEQEALSQITDAAIGAWATYGDSIPIDSLSESINETIQAGEVTGSFADVLNWAGESEDEFNERLAAAQDETERANIVLQQMAKQGLTQAGQAWQQNNQDLVAANQAQANLNATLGQLATTLQPVITMATTGLNQILTGAMGLFSALQSGGVTEWFASLQAGITQFVTNLTAQIPAMITTGASMLTSFAQGVVSMLPTVLDAGMQILASIVEGITQALPDLVASAGTMVTDYLGAITEKLPSILDSGVQIVTSLIEGIVNSIPELVAQLPQIISAFVDYIVSALPQIVSAGGQILSSLVSGLIGAIPELVLSIPDIVGAIIGGLKQAISGAVDVGRMIVEGIWEGISGAASWLWGKLEDFGNWIIGGVKGIFGIASPSKVMRDEVGRYMAQGIGVGFEEEMASVASRMERAIPIPTVDTINNAAAGMVNGMAAASAGQSFPATIVLQLDNGAEIARWQLPYLRAAQRANPEVLSGV